MADSNKVPLGIPAIRGFVARHQLSQRKIAKVYGARESYISGLLRGRQRHSREVRQRLRRAVAQVAKLRGDADGQGAW